MRYYSFFVQVDFDKPKTMPPNTASPGPWEAVGYFQRFLCTESSKEKAKKLVLHFIRENEKDFNSYHIRFDRSAWIRGLSKREDIDFFNELTDEMFENRNNIGIWFIGTKEYCVSEEDWAKSQDWDT